MRACEFCGQEFDPGRSASGQKRRRRTCGYECASALTDRTISEGFDVYRLWEADTARYAKMHGVAPWAWLGLAHAEVQRRRTNSDVAEWEASRPARQRLIAENGR